MTTYSWQWPYWYNSLHANHYVWYPTRIGLSHLPQNISKMLTRKVPQLVIKTSLVCSTELQQNIIFLVRGLVKKEWEWIYYSANTLGRVQLDMVFFKVVPIELYALGPTCLPVLEDVLEPISWHHLQNRLRPLQNGLEESKRWPRSSNFRRGNRKKSHGARSGLYGGCGTHSMFFWAKYWATTFETWGRALSWCRRQRDGFSWGRFRRMCSSRVFKTVM
jgi:hypothetical protein